MSEAEEARRRKVIDRAIGMAVAVIVGGCDTTLSEARAALLEGMDAVPRAQHDRGLQDAEWLREEVGKAWRDANLATIGREKAEAETARLREALAWLVRAVERLDERPLASEASVLSDVMRHARATLLAEDGEER